VRGQPFGLPLTPACNPASITRMKRLLLGCLLVASLVSVTSCRSVMYSTYEKFGV